MRGYLNKDTNEITPINQIEAEGLGLPDYDYDVTQDGRMFLKGFAPKK
jgi:hypothetical protein